MNQEFEKLKHTKQYLLKLIDDLTIDELNEIPPGFNNNIIWNLAHIVAAEQGLCYTRSNKKLVVDENFYLAYKPGTRPERYIDSHEVAIIKELNLSVLEQLKNDYQNNLFSEYTPFVTRYGVGINNIEEAIQFLIFHQGLHVGYIMAMKHLVKK